MGLIDIHAGWLIILTLVPFLSPFMMLGRAATGVASVGDRALDRAAGRRDRRRHLDRRADLCGRRAALGQRPGAQAVWRLLREGM
jgi:hypothetical protein